MVGSGDFVKVHVTIQRRQLEWLDRKAQETTAGRSHAVRTAVEAAIRQEAGKQETGSRETRR